MPNVQLRPYEHASAFRRIAAVAWDDPRDPSIYGTMRVRGEALTAWIAAQREQTGERITITHAVARAVALSFRKHPDLNAMVRWGRTWLREDVDVFLQVAIEDPDRAGKTDLSGLCVRKADTKTVAEMAREIRSAAERIRRREDPDFARTKKQAFSIPPLAFRWLLKLLNFLQYGLNVDTTRLGAPRDPFGSAMITSLGMKGVEIAYAPFFPLARVPLIVLVGAMERQPVVDGDDVRPGLVLTLSATFDHRLVDGVHAAILANEIRALLENPEGLG